MKFKIQQKGRHKSFIILLKSPACGISTKFLSENPDDLCDRLNFLLQEEQAGNNFDIFNKEMIAVVDNFLEYKCTSEKKHKQVLI